MADKFVANPVTLRTEGNKIIDEAMEFKKNEEKLFTTIDNLVKSGYVSPAAKEIANNIATYVDDLNRMQKTIRQYGSYCLTAADKVIKNENRIIQEIE